MGKLKATGWLVKAAAPIAIEGVKAMKTDKKAREERHIELLAELNQKLEKTLSFTEVFKRGVVRGVGAAVGATIIAAIVLGVVGRIINTVDDVPLIRDIIEQANIDDSLSQ